MLHITGFDGVLGGVTGVVYSVVFGVLSHFVIFISDVIVGIQAVTDILFFQDSIVLLLPHLV